MCRFLNITEANFEKYFSNIAFLFVRYKHFLTDDFEEISGGTYKYIKNFVLSRCPFFWVILDEQTDRFAGFVFLDNLIGNSQVLYCAELSTCFEKAFWGGFTKGAARKFLKYCFSEIGMKKIKAQIYPENVLVKNILAYCGFEKEGVLKSETVRRSKSQDVELYGLLKENFLKGLI